MSSSSSEINTTYSDLALMVGGQILILFILTMIAIFGIDSISQPLRAFQQTLSSTLLNSSPQGK